MANQDFDQASNSPLTKLLEVDSDLAVQETELLSHLESVQEKRKSLKTVIGMFTKVDTSANAPVEVAQTPPAETSPATATAESKTAAADTQLNGAKKTAPSPTTKGKPTTKFTHKAKAAKRASGWQHYVRDEFTNNSLPEAVSAVLQRHADKVFEIPGVVRAIFIDNLPTDVGSKARRQVTNILSEGARKKKWYRGQLGYYSMSKAAAEVKS